MKFHFSLITAIFFLSAQSISQTYTMPEETSPHEGTWIQWPHNYLYGPWYVDDVEAYTFIAMTNALQSGENVHIIAYDSVELANIISVLTTASVPFTNLDFYVHQTDDVWSRDNGPMFVYNESDQLTILDWGFNGWGNDTPYTKCDLIPQSIGADLGIPVVDLNAMVLEGGALEHDGHGTMIATRSSITHSSRNPGLTEAQIETYLATYVGITNFIWLDGVYGLEITDMHIDGVLKFANDSTIVTMDSLDLIAWDLSASDASLVIGASNSSGDLFNQVIVPLTQNNVITSYGTDLGYKGSYVNYYIGNSVVLVPTYGDPNDAVAIGIIQGVHPSRTVVGIDVRNLYAYGGMIHCITQQQPVELVTSGLIEEKDHGIELFQNSPNPFNEYTTISFDLEVPSKINLIVYDELGRPVNTLIDGKLLSGNQSITLCASDYEAGLYYYSLSVDGELSSTKRMIIVY
ncbi:MAG: agmatine deiminase [Flavobacteriaceae bacterium]|jgi:agmatine deiminase